MSSCTVLLHLSAVGLHRILGDSMVLKNVRGSEYIRETSLLERTTERNQVRTVSIAWAVLIERLQ